MRGLRHLRGIASPSCRKWRTITTLSQQGPPSLDGVGEANGPQAKPRQIQFWTSKLHHPSRDYEDLIDTTCTFISLNQSVGEEQSKTMRLLNINQCLQYNDYRPEDFDVLKRELKQRHEPPEVHYAIISHVWMDPGNDYQNEIMIDELKDWEDCSRRKKRGADKVKGACQAARRWSDRRKTWEPEAKEISHIWLDSCCINQRDQAEVSMSINSMYRWYRQAAVCLVYLSDVRYNIRGRVNLSMCKWLKRGWTLQELIGSDTVEFFDVDWNRLGNKSSLRNHLATVSGIDEEVLSDPSRVGKVSVAQRMSWACKRETRIEEDSAYCLMGLFGVQMPTLYGEGKERAFRRLQEEIIRYSDDHSVFAWLDQSPESYRHRAGNARGLLAPYAACFEQTGLYRSLPTPGNARPYAMTNKGLDIDLYLQQHPQEDKYIACLDCQIDKDHYLGIFLKRISPESRQYVRTDCHKFCQIRANGRGTLTPIYVVQELDI